MISAAAAVVDVAAAERVVVDDSLVDGAVADAAAVAATETEALRAAAAASPAAPADPTSQAAPFSRVSPASRGALNVPCCPWWRPRFMHRRSTKTLRTRARDLEALRIYVNLVFWREENRGKIVTRK